MQQPNYEDIARIREFEKYISSRSPQNLITGPHAEGTIQYFYVLANSSKENKNNIDEFKNIFNNEILNFKKFIQNAKGEIGDADNGIHIGILFVEKLINKSKDFKSFYNELERYVTSNQKGRMIYHKMKLLNPDSRLETFTDKVIDGVD